jgi:3-dehydroquinate dehydratase
LRRKVERHRHQIQRAEVAYILICGAGLPGTILGIDRVVAATIKHRAISHA